MHLAPLAFFDLEMTGLDLTRDAVIEIAVVYRQGQHVIDDFATLVCPPPTTWNDASAALHGIDPHALTVAPKFPDIADRLHRMLVGRAIPVAHGATLDQEFLRRGVRRVQLGPGRRDVESLIRLSCRGVRSRRGSTPWQL